MVSSYKENLNPELGYPTPPSTPKKNNKTKMYEVGNQKWDPMFRKVKRQIRF